MTTSLTKIQIEQAGALNLALQLGYAELAEVVEWADGIIESSQVAENAITDISFALNISDAVSALGDISNGANASNTLRLFLKRFEHSKFMSIENASKLAKFLYFLRVNEIDYEDPDFGCFESHWDAIDLARDGIFGDPEESVREFLDDLRKVGSKYNTT